MKIKKAFFCFALLMISFFISSCSLFKNEKTINEKDDLSELILDYRSSDDLTYDGTEKQVEIIVKSKSRILATILPNEESEDFLVTYENNINAGLALATVYAKDTSTSFKGSNSVSFIIYQARKDASSFDELKEMAASNNYSTIKLLNDITIETDQELVISEETFISNDGFLLINKGKIINNGILNFVNTPNDIDFINEGELISEGRLNFTNVEVYNNGKIENKGMLYHPTTSNSIIYTNTDINNFINDHIRIYRRYSIEDFDVSLEYDQALYTSKEITPKVTISKDGEEADIADYEIIYENNIDAGLATVRIKSKNNAKKTYGEKTLYFNIERSLFTVTDEASFYSALENPNYYQINASNIDLDKDFTISADKTVIFNNVTLLKEANVLGKLINEDGIFTLDGKLNVSENASFTNNSTMYILGQLLGDGEIINNKSSQVFVANAGQAQTLWNNDGTIYVDDNYDVLTSGSGEVVKRRRISNDDIKITNNNEKYNNEIKAPNLQFLNEIAPLKNTYSIETFNKETNELVYYPKEKGKYIVNVSILYFSTDYCGSVTLDYEILAGEAHVNTLDELNLAFQNKNYEKILIESNLEFDGIYVPSDQELIICENIYVVNSWYIDIAGKFINYGHFATLEKSKIEFKNNGVFINYGSCYFNDNNLEGLIDEGETYIRKNILDSEALDFVSEYKYNGAICPLVNLKIDDIELQNEDYTLAYKNNSYVTDTDPALITITASIFSKYVYGTKELEFRIIGSEISVYSLDDMINSVNNIRPDSTLCNYARINLMVDVDETNDGHFFIYINICSNTTLNLGEHKLILKMGEYNSRYIIINNGIIETLGNPELNFINYEGTGKIVGYASTAEVLEEMTHFCDEIILQNDITDGNGILIYPGIYNDHDVVIDLKGFTISVSVSVDIWKASVEIKNGTIKSETYSISLTLKEYNPNNNTLKLTDLIIYGLSSSTYDTALFSNCTIL